MLATTLDMRRPRPLDRGERSLAQAIQLRERAYQAAGWAMLAMGAAALLVGPAMIATASHLAWDVAWWLAFGVACLTLVPLLFFIETATRGRDIEQVVGDGTITTALLAERSGSSLTDILLWGPRMVLWARQRWARPVAAATLHDAAAVVSFLRHFPNGVEADELPTVQPLRVLCYLVSRDWVAVSKSGDRVWLLNEGRQAIEQFTR